MHYKLQITEENRVVIIAFNNGEGPVPVERLLPLSLNVFPGCSESPLTFAEINVWFWDLVLPSAKEMCAFLSEEVWQMNEEEVDKDWTPNGRFSQGGFLSLPYLVSQFSWGCQWDVTQLCSRGYSLSEHGSPCREQVQLLESDQVIVRNVWSGSVAAACDQRAWRRVPWERLLRNTACQSVPLGFPTGSTLSDAVISAAGSHAAVTGHSHCSGWLTLSPQLVVYHEGSPVRWIKVKWIQILIQNIGVPPFDPVGGMFSPSHVRISINQFFFPPSFF